MTSSENKANGPAPAAHTDQNPPAGTPGDPSTARAAPNWAIIVALLGLFGGGLWGYAKNDNATSSNTRKIERIEAVHTKKIAENEAAARSNAKSIERIDAKLNDLISLRKPPSTETVPSLDSRIGGTWKGTAEDKEIPESNMKARYRYVVHLKVSVKTQLIGAKGTVTVFDLNDKAKSNPLRTNDVEGEGIFRWGNTATIMYTNTSKQGSYGVLLLEYFEKEDATLSARGRFIVHNRVEEEWRYAFGNVELEKTN